MQFLIRHRRGVEKLIELGMAWAIPFSGSFLVDAPTFIRTMFIRPVVHSHLGRLTITCINRERVNELIHRVFSEF